MPKKKRADQIQDIVASWDRDGWTKSEVEELRDEAESWLAGEEGDEDPEIEGADEDEE